MKKYTKAPLPFIGQKRNWLNRLDVVDFSGKTVLDIFGGSGLLSHHIKQKYPSAHVVYNDFDNYLGRVAELDKTEALRLQLLSILQNQPRGKIVPDEVKQEILTAIEKSGTEDFLTVSSWLLFSGNIAFSLKCFASKKFYNSVPLVPLVAAGYLDGVEVVTADFRDLITRYKDTENVIIIADPPYLSTTQEGYSAAQTGNYFKLSDAVALAKLLHDQKCILFSSSKSEIDALFELVKPAHMEKIECMATINHSTTYQDQMFLINLNLTEPALWAAIKEQAA